MNAFYEFYLSGSWIELVKNRISFLKYLIQEIWSLNISWHLLVYFGSFKIICTNSQAFKIQV